MRNFVRRNLIRHTYRQIFGKTPLHTRQRRETYRTEDDDGFSTLRNLEGAMGILSITPLAQLLAYVITNSLPSIHLRTHRSHKHSGVAAATQSPAHLATPLTCDGTPVAYPFQCIFHQAIQTRVSGQRTIKLVKRNVDLSDTTAGN